jgi:hypothetical protein
LPDSSQSRNPPAPGRTPRARPLHRCARIASAHLVKERRSLSLYAFSGI